MPLVVLGALLYICKLVRSNRITRLIEACQFLWMDYDSSIMFWDFINLVRLISLIIFIGTEEGSENIVRLIIATFICIIYGTILSCARPYTRDDHLDLTIISNFLLTCCFLVGIIIHQSKEDKDFDGEIRLARNCLASLTLTMQL